MFSFRGGSSRKEKYSIADTVERLCDRITTSSGLEDRRDAVRGLKGLSRKYRVEVGAQGLPVLANTLATHHTDSEILVLCVDTLYNVMCDKPSPAEEDSDPDSSDESSVRPPKPKDLGVQFTEMFLKEKDVLPSILNVMEDYDFTARWASVKLLSLLVENAQSRMQTLFLSSPTATSRVIDLLSDHREVIRNQAIILLTFITHNSSAIQKIVAFESGFEKILSIIEDEGFSDGLIVVEDCIHLINALLYRNVSNLTFFLEGGFCSDLSSFFNFTCSEDTQWSSQKISNVFYMLKVVKELCSPDNPQQTTTAYQKVLFKQGLLNKVSLIVVSPGVPVKVLAEAIVCLGNMIAHYRPNQNFLENVMTLTSPPKPALLSLLMLMTNDRQPLALRCAVLYCFHCFLAGNEEKKTDVVNTLLPSKVDVSSVTSGQLLCGGLFSKDAASNWLCAVALSYTLNNHQKEQLLRVQLATSIGNPPVTLMAQTVTVLTNADSAVQAKLGMMMLQCIWLHNCPHAVSAFLSIPAVMPFFIAQLSDSPSEAVFPDSGGASELQGLAAFLLGVCFLYNEDNKSLCQFDRKSIRHIVEKRIGVETFKRLCSQLSLCESFSKNSRKCSSHYADMEAVKNLMFDFQFVSLYKQLENQILMSISGDEPETNGVDHEKEISNYKEMIRQQDEQLKALEARLGELSQHLQYTQAENESLKYQMGQMTQVHNGYPTPPDPQNHAENEEKLRTQESKIIELQQQLQYCQSEAQSFAYQLSQATAQPSVPQPTEDSEIVQRVNEENEKLKLENARLLSEHSELNERITSQDSRLKDLAVDNESLRSQVQSLTSRLEVGNQEEEAEKLKWYETQFPVLQQQYERLYQQLYEVQSQFNEQFDPEAKIQSLQSQIYSLETSSSQYYQESLYLREQLESCNTQLATLTNENTSLQAQLNEISTRDTTREEDVNRLRAENERLKSEFEQSESKIDSLLSANQDLTNQLAEATAAAASQKSSDVTEISRALTNGLHIGDQSAKDQEDEMEKLRGEKADIESQLESLRTDQEDLMVLLADQDTKLKYYKDRLRSLGEQIESDDSGESSSSEGDD